MEDENSHVVKRPSLKRQKDSKDSVDEDNPSSMEETIDESEQNPISDDDDVEFFFNPSGSVLRPSENPYDKQKRIQEANLALSEMPMPITPLNTKIRFNEIAKTIELIEESQESVEEPESGKTNESFPLCENGNKEEEDEQKEQEENDNKGTNVVEAQPPRQLVVSLYPDPRTSVDLPSEGSETEDDIYSDDRNSKEDELALLYQADDISESEVSEEIEEVGEGEEEVEVEEDVTVLEKSQEEIEDLRDSLERALSIREDTAEEAAKGEKEVRQRSPPPGAMGTRRGVRPASCRPRPPGVPPPPWRRPRTAPTSASHHAHRTCTAWRPELLPQYNGLRSEYGLTAEQLQERKRAFQRFACHVGSIFKACLHPAFGWTLSVATPESPDGDILRKIQHFSISHDRLDMRKIKIERAKALRLRKIQRSADDERRREESNMMFSSWLAKKRREANEKLITCAKLANARFNFKTQLAPTSHL
ncbi:hypothetical protein AAG570_006698 [Ranatra chinensis]|uniref:Coiled-coil domain-containing protein 181 n=1 Tax=Ranatra chinensis TaxID=642074 RepID=A0ABD0YV28_9HEMI